MWIETDGLCSNIVAIHTNRKKMFAMDETALSWSRFVFEVCVLLLLLLIAVGCGCALAQLGLEA